jgi:aconitase A
MPFDQNQLPTWNKEGVEPPQSLKDNGWQPSQKPPADYFNWFFNKTFKALQSLFASAQHKEEKGQPGGYAALDVNGKVINADGTYPGGATTANAITITDDDSYYAGEDVEAALQEIGQTLNAMRGSLIDSVNNILDM